MQPSSGDKCVLCYCHFGGELIENGENQSMHYKGGRTMCIMTTPTTTFDEFVTQIKKKLNLIPELELKYSLDYDKTQLLNLVNEEDLHDLLNFSEKFAHIYVFLTEEASESWHHEEQQCAMNYSRTSDHGGEVLGQHCNHPNSNTRIVSDNINLVTTCADGEQLPATSELWKNEIYGSGQTFKDANALRCPWRLNANQVGKTDFLSVGKFIVEHSHSAQDVINSKPKARSKLAASFVATKLRMQLDTTPNQIKAAFATELNVEISYKQAWQLKEQAMRLIHGMPNESYSLVPWLCKRIREADENAITEYEASLDHQFAKVFISYGCSILGFLLGCRPIIYIDGCHLSGPYKGTLLSATAFDADNRLFHLAYAIVTSERYEDCHWFLTKLKEATRSVDVTIVSDRHKNILSSVAEIFGKENHAYCYRHIKENFSTEVNKVLPRTKEGKKNALKLLDSVIMYARLDIDFQISLKNLRVFKPELAEWVLRNEPEHWVLSKFSKRRWDQVTTNIAESFNAWVVNERRHYVFSFMNEHRDKLASKLFKAKEDMKSWKNGVGPKIEAKLLENVVRGETMIVLRYGRHSTKVTTGYADLSVDLATRTCTCFGWQMSGIPRPHACASIRKLKGNLYEYVDDWYKLPKQELIYSNLMVPIETHDMPKKGHDGTFIHDIEDEEFLSPPTTKRPPGRPRVNRIESQFMKKRKIQCSRCHEIGHNRAKCKNPNPN